MTAETLHRVAAQQKYRNFVAPIDDEEYGRELFFHGYGRSACMNETQRFAFDAAAQEARRALTAEWLTADIQQIAA